jgi:hypothetical protein
MGSSRNPCTPHPHSCSAWLMPGCWDVNLVRVSSPIDMRTCSELDLAAVVTSHCSEVSQVCVLGRVGAEGFVSQRVTTGFVQLSCAIGNNTR